MGTKIAEVMTQRPRAVTAQTTVREAARLMDEEDVGSLPVVDDTAHLIGIVTDRDVAVRVVGRGLDSDTTVVGDVASRDVVALTPDHDLDDALKLMAREQVRRVPIVVRENELVGMPRKPMSHMPKGRRRPARWSRRSHVHQVARGSLAQTTAATPRRGNPTRLWTTRKDRAASALNVFSRAGPTRVRSRGPASTRFVPQ